MERRYLKSAKNKLQPENKLKVINEQCKPSGGIVLEANPNFLNKSNLKIISGTGGASAKNCLTWEDWMGDDE